MGQAGESVIKETPGATTEAPPSDIMDPVPPPGADGATTAQNDGGMNPDDTLRAPGDVLGI